MRFQRQSLIYQKILSDNVYYRNVNNNAGIFDYIIGEAEEQECKEAFLAYYFLLAPGDAPTEDALDRRIEDWLKTNFGADIDFECDDALAKLDRLGLLRRDGDRLSVLPLDEALIRLDRIWDNFFPFDGARQATPGEATTRWLVQRPGLPTPSPFMKRLRISAGSRGVCAAPGLVVDLGRQQHRPAVVEAPVDAAARSAPRRAPNGCWQCRRPSPPRRCR